MIHNKNQLWILKIGIGSSMIVGLGPLKLHKQTRKDNHTLPLTPQCLNLLRARVIKVIKVVKVKPKQVS